VKREFPQFQALNEFAELLEAISKSLHQ
jgi:hypothetical protein